MSHDGVRFVSADQAAADRARGQERLSGEAVRPAKVRVDQTGGTGVTVDWRDGHRSHWPFRWLRDACPCATCIEAREAEGRAPGVGRPQPTTLLPMYQAPPRPEAVEPIGRYAVKFRWNDGHEAGLYSWDYLRNTCDAAYRQQTAAQRAVTGGAGKAAPA